MFTPKETGTIVLFVTRQKQAGLTACRDALFGDGRTWEGEKGHASDQRIARAAETGESIHPFYREVHRTPFRYHGQALLTLYGERRDGPSRFEFQLVHDLSAIDDIDVHSPELVELASTERAQITEARVGQRQFRGQLLTLWNGCAVTGVARPDLVRASHIRSWRMRSNDERLDPSTGLLLLPKYDHIADTGYIPFDADGRLLESPVIAAYLPSVLRFDGSECLHAYHTSLPAASPVGQHALINQGASVARVPENLVSKVLARQCPESQRARRAASPPNLRT